MATQIDTVLLDIDKFRTPREFHNLLILAEAVAPLSRLETISGVPELFSCLCQIGWKEAKALAVLKRMLEKAQFNHKYVAKLKKFVTEEDERKERPALFFHELIVLVGNKLGDGESLKRLLFIITDEHVGMSRQLIKTAPELFQRLLHAEVITPLQPRTLDCLHDWMVVIGRSDIASEIKHFRSTHPIRSEFTTTSGKAIFLSVMSDLRSVECNYYCGICTVLPRYYALLAVAPPLPLFSGELPVYTVEYAHGRCTL